MLGPADPLPRCPRRVLVAGTSGAGKTTLAKRIAGLLGVPRVEIDGLYHGPGWVPLKTFQAEVDRFSSRPSWVTEWQYPSVRAVLADRADLLVWLDLPRRTVVRQVVLRTLRRRLGRQQLWNGNVEPPLRTFWTDPEHIVRWAWSSHGPTAQRVHDVADRRPDLLVVRVRSRRAARRWLAGPVTAAAGG